MEVKSPIKLKLT